MERVYKEKTHHHKKQEEIEPIEVKTESKEELKNDLDDILEDIDSVLEENAEEFVKNYVQKGGQLHTQSRWTVLQSAYEFETLSIMQRNQICRGFSKQSFKQGW